MGRELRRVPMNFSAPLNKVWEGYVNPHYKKCPDCRHGRTKGAEAFERLVHLLMVAGGDASRGYRLHPWLAEAGVEGVSPDLAELTSKLAGRPASQPFGPDACDRWSAEKKILKAAGMPKNWGVCQTCKGDAVDPSAKPAYSRWRSKSPPRGKGYQLWETTSEGSPISPVFASIEAVCDYAAEHCTTFGSQKTTALEWRRMLDANFVAHEETLPNGVKAIFL